jgi:hypothetical protein
MGTNCNADTIDPTEIINYIFKKQIGYANTSKLGIYFSEGNNYNSYKPTTTDLLFSQYIPQIPPTDLIQVSFCNINPYSNLSGQAKYISSNYPYLAFYSNVFMNPATTGILSNSFTVSTYPQFQNILTKNAIPYSYGVKSENGTNNYKATVKLFASNGITSIPFGATNGGYWIFDTDSGIVTFYDTPTVATINRTTPPRISFWRYEGLIGNNTIMNIADF